MADRRELERLQGEIEGLITDLWQVPRFARAGARAHRPQADCYRSLDPPRLTVVVELPGVDPAAVEIVALPGSLVVSGRRDPPASGRVQQLEIDYGPFRRHVPLPDDVDVEQASASYARGLLTVVFPIAAAAPQPERVTIVVQVRS